MDAPQCIACMFVDLFRPCPHVCSESCVPVCHMSAFVSVPTCLSASVSAHLCVARKMRSSGGSTLESLMMKAPSRRYTIPPPQPLAPSRGYTTSPPSTSAPQAAGTPHARPTPARRDVVWISGAPLRCVHACRQAAQQRRLQCMHMGEPPMCAMWGLGGRDLDIFVLPFYSLSPPLSRAPPPLPYPLGGCCENSTEIFCQPLCGRKSPLGQQLSEETQNQPQIKPRTNSTTNGSSRCVGSWHEQPTLRSH